MPSRRSIMRRTFRLLLALTLLLSTAAPLLAVTIRLKDGSVFRGKVIGFKDQQFTILIGGNSRGRRGQTTVYVEDVESIEFDSNTGGATDDSTASNVPPVSQPPRNTQASQPEPTNNQPNNVPTSSNSAPAAPTYFTIKVGVRADNRNNGWTNSGLGVRKGQRLRISGSGRVSL